MKSEDYSCGGGISGTAASGGGVEATVLMALRGRRWWQRTWCWDRWWGCCWAAYTALGSRCPPPSPCPTGAPRVHPACDGAPALARTWARTCHLGWRASDVYKTPKAFKIKIGVKPFGSSKLERINEPPSCSYRQLMGFWEGFAAR